MTSEKHLLLLINKGYDNDNLNLTILQWEWFVSVSTLKAYVHDKVL